MCACLAQGVVDQRLSEGPDNWRLVYKTLLLLEYMLKHGPMVGALEAAAAAERAWLLANHPQCIRAYVQQGGIALHGVGCFGGCDAAAALQLQIQRVPPGVASHCCCLLQCQQRAAVAGPTAVHTLPGCLLAHLRCPRCVLAALSHCVGCVACLLVWPVLLLARVGCRMLRRHWLRTAACLCWRS